MVIAIAAMVAAPSLLFVFAVWRGKVASQLEGEEDSNLGAYGLIIPLTFMLMVRVLPAGLFDGYITDVQTFQAWAVQAAKGLSGFYSGSFFADYPPGYIYVLFLLGKLRELLHLQETSRMFLLLIKMPAICADLVTVMLIYRLGADRYGRRHGQVAALFYGFNPAIIMNSAVWGQVDAVFTLFMLLSVLNLTRNHLVRGVAFFSVALLVKPQALIFSPLLIAVVLDRLVREKRPGGLRTVFSAAAAGVTTFVLGIAPFSLHEGGSWIFRHYYNTLTSYPYASVNAFNLFALCGGNFAAESGTLLFLPYRSWGLIFILLLTLFVVALSLRGTDYSRQAYLAALLVAAVFTLGSRMHERYLFPTLVFLLVAYLYRGDYRLLALYVAYSVSHLFNVGYVLLASRAGVYQVSPFDPLLLCVSGFNLILLSYLIYYGWFRLGRVDSHRSLPGGI